MDRDHPLLRRGLPLSLLLLAVAVGAPGRAAEDRPLPEPSANAGREGAYKATTSREGYAYYVAVPGSYSPDNPAGIHVFFHGMGGQRMARNFRLWRPFLTGSNCIGINMEFADGNPHDDPEGKMAAAVEAVRQVTADYHVVIGRGAMTVFSAGGSPGGRWLHVHGKETAEASTAWPFNHVSVFGAGLNCGEELTARPCSWARFMGDGEQRMAPGLFAYMLGRTASNLRDDRRNACHDVLFFATRGRGHTILPEEVERAAACFRRSATVFAPFVEKPADVDAGIGRIIDAANARRYAEALALIERSRAAAAKRTLTAKVEEQIAAQVTMVRDLAEDDPSLAAYYARATLAQVDGTDAEQNVERAFAPVLAEDRRHRRLRAKWAEHLPEIFDAKALRLKEGGADFLEEIRAAAGESSTLGLMAEHFLEFAP